MSGPTPTQVATFWQYMTYRFGASVVDKKNAVENNIQKQGSIMIAIVKGAGIFKINYN